MADNSFDVVSKVDMQEVRNAVDQATKEVRARFDLKDSKSTIEIEGADVIQLASADEYKLKNVQLEKLEPASNSSVRQKLKLQQGIPIETAKKITALIKDSKKKAQASIQGDTIRVSSKDRDTLQEIMALLRAKDLGCELQFTNYRSN